VLLVICCSEDNGDCDLVAVPYVEAEYALLNETSPSTDKLADCQPSQVDSTKGSARTRRKGRAQRPAKTRDSQARDELTAFTNDQLKTVSPRPVIVDSIPALVTTTSNKAAAVSSVVDSNKAASLKVVDAEVRVTAKNPTSRVVEITSHSASDLVENNRSKTSLGKAADIVKAAAVDNKQPVKLLTAPEKAVVNQSAASPVKIGAAPVKIANTPTPKKGVRKEEDWKEVVRPVPTKPKKMFLPANVAGLIIGRNGLHLHAIRHYTGAHLDVDKISGSKDRNITIKGSAEAIKLATDVVTALMSRSDKEVEQLLTKMKNKLASSNNPADLAAFDPESKALPRSSRQSAAPAITAATANVISSSSVTVSSVSYSAIISKAHSTQQSQQASVANVSNSNFSIGVWDNPASGRVAGEATKTSSSSCARQLFADSSAPPPPTAKSAPTYASSMTPKTKVVTSLTSAPSTDASNLRLPLNQPGTVVSSSLVSPMRLDQPPLPIKSSAIGNVDGRPNSGFSASSFATEYSPFSGGLVTDVLAGKGDPMPDGRMNFASVAAAGVVGSKNQSPPAPGVTMGVMHDNGDANSLEDLKAKAPGYKPRMTAADNKAQSSRNKLPSSNMFYSQSSPGVIPSLGAISISMPVTDDSLPMELHHGPLTPGEYYDRPMTASSTSLQQDALSSHSNSSTPASSLSPRSSSDGGKQRKDEYASPHQPMTLPKVESRLNPEAPDFTLPTSRHSQGVGAPNYPPPFASFLMGGPNFASLPDMTSMPPPPEVTIYNQQVSAISGGQLPPYGRLPNSFAQFNAPAQQRQPPIGKPLSRGVFSPTYLNIRVKSHSAYNF
jgi:hypothetical protein